ncbi:MAG: hypothetical protein M5R36_09045 [Deltaproteobacteria bacterium]|nr:hypothetical protein [Deltaproteobacteria bacterium]
MMRRLMMGIAVFVALARAAAAQEPVFGDYLDLPNNANAADPSVIEVDGTYYLYPTNSYTTIECWSSGDLETWAYEGGGLGAGGAGGVERRQRLGA